MAQSTISKIFREVTAEMEAKLCEKWIRLNPKNFRESKDFFFDKYKIPGVVGCIDGTHVFILRPKHDEQMFFNRKGTHSINVMIICDHTNKITAINAAYGGAASDSFVWEQSGEKAFFQNSFETGDDNSRLLGDCGYAIAPWLLTPYRTANSANGEEHYNIVHSKARSIVERSVGIWKGRWRCLQDDRKMRYSPEIAASIINVTAALHNICVHYNVELSSTDLYVQPNEIRLYPPVENMEDNDFSRLGQRLRSQIKNSLIH